MTVGTPMQPDFETQNATLYKTAIDNAIAVQSRLGWAFAPHESDPAAMTVTVDAGALLVSGQLVEVAAQTTGTITAPAANPRIDLVYIDPADDGAVGVAAGSEAADPDPPALPSGMLPICEVLLATDTTAISNLLITDRRVGAGGAGGGLNPGEPSELTIDAGAVTVTGGYHTVDTEADAGTDNLDTIDASPLGEGALVILAAENAARVVTLRSGEDNITLAGPNYALDAAAKRILLQKAAGGGLVEVARSHAAGLQIGAVQATTSGTAKDFTGIPAGTRQITVNFNEVSLNGSDNILVQIGDSGGLETSGYLATAGSIVSTATGSVSSTAGFVIRTVADAQVTSGSMILTLLDPATNTWVASGTAKSNTTTVQVLGGSKALSAELDRLRITRSGSNSFDAGSVNILYQ
jgi:hypothetical protein